MDLALNNLQRWYTIKTEQTNIICVPLFGTQRYRWLGHNKVTSKELLFWQSCISTTGTVDYIIAINMKNWKENLRIISNWLVITGT